jgi:hypothetical protein
VGKALAYFRRQNIGVVNYYFSQCRICICRVALVFRTNITAYTLKMDNNSNEQLWWARAQTIATFVGLGVFVLQIFTLLYDRVVRAKAVDPGKRASDEGEMSYFRVPKLSWWSAFRGFTTETPQLTTIRGLIEAGDDYLWTSAALDHLQSQHGNLSWVPLYEAVFSQIARHNDCHLESRSVIPVDSKLASAIKHPTTNTALKRAQRDLSGTRNERYELYDKGKLIRCVRPLDKAMDAPKPEHPRREKRKGLIHLASAWMLRGIPCVQTSREELAALALTLGIPLKINDYTQNVSGVGPFGTGFDMIQDNGIWRLELIHGSRLPRHTASRSSGYSVLFAKHLAFGSLPFAENKHWVRSVYISPAVLRAIKNGQAIKDGKSFGGRPLQILRSLPAAKQIDAIYHTGDKVLDEDNLGCILNSNGNVMNIQIDGSTTVAANWCRAVVGIVFGGLVPQASKNLSAAVTFTVGRILGDVVDGLENLINKLHNCDTGANIFGDHVTERCDALHLVDYVHYATPSRYDTQEAAAVFARFMNLLERMAILSKYSVEDIFENVCTLIHCVYVEAIMRRRGRAFPANLLDRNLGIEIDRLASRFEEHTPPPDIRLEDCTLVVWCILAVWASRVPHGESEDFGEEDFGEEDFGEEDFGEKDFGKKENPDDMEPMKNSAPQTRRQVSLIDLPQLIAFS